MKGRLKYGLMLAGALAVLAGDIAIAAAEGVLTIGRREDGTTMDPIKTAQNVDFWVFSNMYDVLVRVDKTGTKLEPGLAESWTVSDDQLTYTFTLRDAKFSDGSPITAEDAAWNLKRIRDHKESLWGATYSVIKDAVAKDAKTLVVTLNQPTAPFLSTLAMPGISILSKKATEADEAGVSDNPVSSGAFVMKEWRRGEVVVLEKNPNFWEADRVSLDGVQWISVPDDNTRVLKLQAGELDYIWSYQSMAQAAGLRYVQLAPEIDLGDPARAADYRTATVRVAGRTPGDTLVFHGEPIVYALSIPSAAPHRELAEQFVAWLLSADGRRVLRTARLDALDTPELAGEVPASLRARLGGGH